MLSWKEQNMQQPSFLYIENDEMSREVMKTLLTRGLGYLDLTMFESSSDFEHQLGSLAHKPDVIFVDIHMEPIDGFAMLNLIRQNAEYGAVPVVALTASVMYEEVRTLRDAGFDGVIAKPINYDAFPAILDRILSGEQVWNTK
jgi:CheY-like chemotaxis protein